MREKDIDGYEGIYKIYEDGRVWSYKYNKFIKPFINNTNYYRISLTKDKERYKFYIHRLLAINFIPNPLNRPQVDHIDRNRQNNDLSNLRWVTQAENQANTGVRINNILREKNIYPAKVLYPNKGGYVVRIVRNGINKTKYFKELEDAIDYRNAVLMYYEINKTLEGI